jgi:c-opsin
MTLRIFDLNFVFQIWTPMNTILLNLVCSDFSVSIIGNPFTLTSAIHHHWIFGEDVCTAYGFFMSLLGDFDSA